MLTSTRTPARILAVEDDPLLACHLQSHLMGCGFDVTLRHDGSEGLQLAEREDFDLILMDILLPGISGLEALQRLRRQRSVPVLLMSALGDEQNRIAGFSQGADDYLPKPFEPRELLARIRALLRRREAEVPASAKRLQFGPLVIDSALREAWLREHQIELTGAEFDLLWLLTSNPGRILSREEIFAQLRGIEYDGQDRSIDVRISRIRPKIGDDPMHPRLIKTVRSKGYLFVAEAAEALPFGDAPPLLRD